jgi:hypothetical protein
MENWERDTLKNLYDFHRQIDWIELPENIGEFFERLPEIHLDERGLTLSVYSGEHELVLGFGEYGGVGEMFDGLLYWQTYTHKDEPTNWEMGGDVPNGSPKFVWHKVYEELSRKIESMGANK